MRILRVVGGLAMATVVTAHAQQQSKFDELAIEGNLAFSRARFADAERFYLEALDHINDASDANSGQLAILVPLATIYNIQGRYTEAESLCRRALIFVQATSPRKIDLVTASIFGTLASIEIHTGQYGKAELNIRRAITIRKQYHVDHDTELLAAYTTLGVVLCGEGHCKQADQVLREALRPFESDTARSQVSIAAAASILGAINMDRRRYREAEECYRRALNMLTSEYGASSAMLVPVLSDLALLYSRRGRYLEADAAGRCALEIAAKELSDSNATAKAALGIGQALLGQGRFEEAEPYFKQSLDIRERNQGAESIEYYITLQQYARFLRKAKRSSEASIIEARANVLLNLAGQTVDVSEFSKHEASEK